MHECYATTPLRAPTHNIMQKNENSIQYRTCFYRTNQSEYSHSMCSQIDTLNRSDKVRVRLILRPAISSGATLLGNLLLIPTSVDMCPETVVYPIEHHKSTARLMQVFDNTTFPHICPTYWSKFLAQVSVIVYPFIFPPRRKTRRQPDLLGGRCI